MTIVCHVASSLSPPFTPRNVRTHVKILMMITPNLICMRPLGQLSRRLFLLLLLFIHNQIMWWHKVFLAHQLISISLFMFYIVPKKGIHGREFCLLFTFKCRPHWIEPNLCGPKSFWVVCVNQQEKKKINFHCKMRNCIMVVGIVALGI